MNLTLDEQGRYNAIRLTSGDAWEWVHRFISPEGELDPGGFQEAIGDECSQLTALLGDNSWRDFYFTRDGMLYCLTFPKRGWPHLYLIGPKEAALVLRVSAKMFSPEQGLGFSEHFKGRLETQLSEAGFNIQVSAERGEKGLFECGWWVYCNSLEEIIDDAFFESMVACKIQVSTDYTIN
jgi:hypothetical protein